MSALSQFFNTGAEVPVGGLVSVAQPAIYTLGNKYTQGNKVFFKSGYYEPAWTSSIQGLGFSIGSGTSRESPVTSFCRIFVGNTLYIFHSGSSTTFYKTTDFISYTTGTLPSAQVITGAAYDPIGNRLVVLSTTGAIFYSSDQGATWGTSATSYPVGSSSHKLVWTGLYFVIHYSGTNIQRSTDGVAWATVAPTGAAGGGSWFIISDGNGRLMILNAVSGNNQAILYLSNDHGSTISSTITGLNAAGGTSSAYTLRYHKDFNYLSYSGVVTVSSTNYITTVVAKAGSNLKLAVNITTGSPSSYAGMVYGDLTKNWGVIYPGYGSMKFNTDPDVMATQTSGVATVGTSGLLFSSGSTWHTSQDGSITIVGVPSSSSYYIVKSYKDFDYYPQVIVGSDSSVTDSNVPGAVVYIRVK